MQKTERRNDTQRSRSHNDQQESQINTHGFVQVEEETKKSKNKIQVIY